MPAAMLLIADATRITTERRSDEVGAALAELPSAMINGAASRYAPITREEGQQKVAVITRAR